MTNLPPELFYQIALHLPFTSDVLTFSLTSSRVRAALSTPALFKERLAQQGWDVSAWLEEDRNVTVPRSPQEDLERWMRINHIYSRTVQLFDEAAADNYFSAPGSEQSYPELHEDITSLDHFRIPSQASKDAQLLGRKTVVWLRKLSEVLPAFLTHHRGRNVSRITEARYHGALLTYARVFFSSNSTMPELLGRLMLAKLLYPWLERTCFCLVALLIQCDTNSVTSIFTNTLVYYPDAYRSLFTFSSSPLPDNVYGYPVDSDPNTLPITTTSAVDPDPNTLPITRISAQQLRISDRYFSTFLIQALISITLHSHTSLPLGPPSLPYVNPAASFSYDEFFEPQLGTTYSLLLPQARPWLRNRLAGTPLAELLSPAGGDGDSSDGRRGRRLWAGYYTFEDGEASQQLPMFLELYSVQDSIVFPNQERDRVEYFGGEGSDGQGTFTLRGTCNTSTGVVVVTNITTEDGSESDWLGMVTPFGMAGIWGVESDAGWWWIWPQEWSKSNTFATTGH